MVDFGPVPVSYTHLDVYKRQVPERLDDVVEGDGDVRDAGLPQERQERAQEAASRPDLHPVRRAGPGGPEVGTEELEGSVDEVQAHARRSDEGSVQVETLSVGRASHKRAGTTNRVRRRPTPPSLWVGSS